MITIKDIFKTFNAGSPDEIKIFRGFNLQISKGDFLVIIGANGSGKSTLLNAIGGSIFPDLGTVEIEDVSVNRLPEHIRSKWIARVFQDPLRGTAADLSIIENFRLASLRTSGKGLKLGITRKFREDVCEKISLLGMSLENKLDQKMGTLSGGQRQALTLLMAVMDELKILLLDEPTAALDPRSAEQVMRITEKLILEYKLTAILVTHNMKDAYKFGNRIIFMTDGTIGIDLNSREKALIGHSDLYKWFE